VSVPELPSAKCISTKCLRNAWKKLSDKHLPDLIAITLNDDDFLHFIDIMHRNPGVKDTRVKEYGINFDDTYIEACSFKVNKLFFIVVKQSAPLTDSVEHELRHIIAYFNC
jgi:hypothetical protein